MEEFVEKTENITKKNFLKAFKLLMKLLSS